MAFIEPNTVLCINLIYDQPASTEVYDKSILFTPSHYFSCICTKETKSEQCDFPTIFQLFEGNFHLFPGNNFSGNLFCYFISLQTFPGKLLCNTIIRAKVLKIHGGSMFSAAPPCFYFS